MDLLKTFYLLETRMLQKSEFEESSQPTIPGLDEKSMLHMDLYSIQSQLKRH